MDAKNMFVNRRYLRFLRNRPLYVNRNGVPKRCLTNFAASKMFDNEDFWYCLADIPERYRERVLDVAISLDDFREIGLMKGSKDRIYDSDKVQIYVTDDTPILPIVGNLLPADGTQAFNVVRQNGELKLEPIIVCWSCHWSELFTGNTGYGSNVFCLASDLTVEKREYFINDIIRLKDVPDYLKSLNEELIEKKL